MKGYKLINGCYYEATDNAKAVWYEVYGALRGMRREDQIGMNCRESLLTESDYWMRLLERSGFTLQQVVDVAWSTIQYHMNFGC